MKQILMLALVAMTVGMTSVAAQAAPSPDATCRVRINGQESGLYSNEDEFFSEVANASRRYNCTYGKIYHGAKSGRVYYNGQLVADPVTGKKRGLSNEEARRAKRAAGGGCSEYSCDEVGIVRGNEELSNEIPYGTIIFQGGW
ncbi:MAG: hypothetical protein NDI61_08250 [Bdellovibrionaceae bacterium]|nr:hypothetical protein [Pseudobdellovibrionaceae bacterium]